MAFNLGAAERHRATLQLAAPFSEPDLKASYRKLIREWHPDRHMSQPKAYAEATEKAKILNVAYEFLAEVLESIGGIYPAPTSAAPQPLSWSDLQPRRTYEGKTYTAGFPDSSVTEIFLRSSHIVSTGYDQTTQLLYIKFSGNAVYRYFGVPLSIFEAFLEAPSHGKFGHQSIYPKYRHERC